MNNNKSDKEKELEAKLNKALNTKDCQGEECKIQDPEELVHRENKKIITNDGRQLLSEYTTR
jgi:hypothetical protein